MQDVKDRLLDAALAHVPFDGWSEASLAAAASDCGLERAEVAAAFPRGAIDLAVAFHARGDARLAEHLAGADLSQMKIREKITYGVRLRLEMVEAEKEAVRRGVTLFSLPLHAGEGAKALWQTADVIWRAIGDTSEDVNWYTKRMTLAGVYSAVLLYWLGDSSEGHEASWAFLDRRIGDVMQIEKVKAGVRESRLLAPLLAGPNWVLSHVKAPVGARPDDMPGHISGDER